MIQWFACLVNRGRTEFDPKQNIDELTARNDFRKLCDHLGQ